MGKEKESWTLLWVWTAYLPVKEIKWEFYVKVSDFTRCMDSMRKELEEENKKLREKIKYIRKLNTYDYNELQDLVITLEEENKKLTKCNLNLQEWLDNKEKVNKSLREELSKLKEKYWDIDY